MVFEFDQQPAEAAIAADVFNPAESDQQYFERRRRELGVEQKQTEGTKP